MILSARRSLSCPRPSLLAASPADSRRGPDVKNRGQAGSVSALTLLAVAAITGAFIYIAVIGSRAAETTRVRVSADATAMAAATVKAKVMNYEAFVLMADAVLLPLGHLTERIGPAQGAASVGCLLVSTIFPSTLTYCLFKYGKHVSTTTSNQPDVDEKVTDWLDGLEAFAEELRRIGPLWAEVAAVRAGTDDSYKGPSGRGVTAAASFPIPTLDPEDECTDLGIEMADNNEKTSDGSSMRDACHDRALPLEQLYLLASMDPLAAAIDQGGLIITGNSLVWNLFGGPARCAKENQVPKLADNWQERRLSRGLALSESPRDAYHLGLLEALRATKPPKNLQTGYLMGMACAEHYASEHYGGDESLWHMDWRARLVPCNFDQDTSADPIMRCGVTSLPGALFVGVDHAAKMQAQFERQRLLGIAKYWKY